MLFNLQDYSSQSFVNLSLFTLLLMFKPSFHDYRKQFNVFTLAYHLLCRTQLLEITQQMLKLITQNIVF